MPREQWRSGQGGGRAETPVDPRAYRLAFTDKGYVSNLSIPANGGQALGVEHPFVFWFRPRTVRARLAAAYEMMQPMGMSHGYHVFKGGENVSLPLTLYVHRLMLARDHLPAPTPATGEGTPHGRVVSATALQQLSDRIMRGVRYLQALLVPPALEAGIVGGAPPACLLVLPHLLALRCRMTEMDLEITDQDPDGRPIEMTAQCTFQEAPLQRITMQDVLLQGMQRTWGIG